MYQYDSANPLRRLVRRSGAWPPMSWLYARTLHHLDRWVYRGTRERTTFVSLVTGLPVVLLTTTGAKSGRRHTLPLVAIPNEDRLIVIASNYGQRRNPAWYHNLKANPSATATLDGVARVMTARESRESSATTGTSEESSATRAGWRTASARRPTGASRSSSSRLPDRP